jgi:hypothetical protein
MGTTYIPGDKQPDWKQNQGPSVVAVSQSDPNNQNMVSGQVNNYNIPTPVQHLCPTSIMPIPSPLTMFDIAPFQVHTSHRYVIYDELLVHVSIKYLFI